MSTYSVLFPELFCAPLSRLFSYTPTVFSHFLLINCTVYTVQLWDLVIGHCSLFSHLFLCPRITKLTQYFTDSTALLCRVVCPKFGQPSQTSDIYLSSWYHNLSKEVYFATIVNERSVLKLFWNSRFFLACLQHVQNLCSVRNSNILKLGHGVGVRACYFFLLLLYICTLYIVQSLLCNRILNFPISYLDTFYLFFKETVNNYF